MSNPLKNIVGENTLNALFFCDQNIQTIQNAIRKSIYDKSGYVIDNQSKRELEIVMRSVYLLYGKNLTNQITQQIDELNKIVVKETSPKIYSNLIQYLEYKKNANSIPLPMTHPKNMSHRGKKSFSLTQF